MHWQLKPKSQLNEMYEYSFTKWVLLGHPGVRLCPFFSPWGRCPQGLERRGDVKVAVPAFAAAVKPVYKSYSDKYGSGMIDAILNTK